MALKKREKILGIVAVGALVVVVYTVFFSGSGESLSSLRANRDKLRQDKESKEAKIRRARQSRARLTEWEKRSLPANPDEAQSKYQDWLRDVVVERLKFRDNEITPPHVSQKKAGVYTAYSFSVQGKVTLKQLVDFLYEFYSAGHLHLVKRLTITPSEDPKSRGLLGVSIIIEALLLPDNARTDKLSEAKPQRPLLANEVYEKAIVGRNLFASYLPPAPPRQPIVRVEPPKPSFDHAKFTKVTGFTEVDGGPPQVWLHYLPSPPPNGKELKLSEGEKFDFGELRGTVVRFHREEDRIRGVEIEMDGKRYLVAIGDNLRNGKELPQ